MFVLAWSFKSAERSAEDLTAKRPTATGWASFLAGLVITLGDQKAIFFYLGFLPGFLDLTSVTKADIVVLILITGVSVGGVKFAYAALASKARVVLEPRWGRWMYRVAGALLALAGVLLWAKALSGS